MCNKAVNAYSSTTKFAFECFMTQEIRDKAVNNVIFYVIVFLINIKHKKCITEIFLKTFFQ